jgi:2-oxoisovalerate dehydrogenase E1 component alpha subunit
MTDVRPQPDAGLATVARFEIRMRRCLDPAGEPVGELPDFASDKDFLRTIYRQMVVTRTFDEKAIALQRTGRLGTYASVLGQEAAGVGVAAAMRATDILLPSFREHGAQFYRGVTIEEVLMFWGGDERGNDFAVPRRDFPNCIPVASHLPHAAGAALALKLGGTDDAAVAMAGDGATSKGDFYEALNIAGVWRLPVLFVIINNGWAISVPRSAQSAAQSLAQKAIAAGIPGEQVDGNDVIAVVAATRAALQSIRAGHGPYLIEALTYRLGDHTTADDARRYRNDAEVSRHWKEDPVVRLRSFMTKRGMWSKDDEQSVIEEARALVEGGAEAYLARPPQPASSIFDHLFETLPLPLRAQRDFLVRREAGKDG